VRVKSKSRLITYLTLQEEEDSGLNEVGSGALSAFPLWGAFLLWFPMAEQSLGAHQILVWSRTKATQNSPAAGAARHKLNIINQAEN